MSLDEKRMDALFHTQIYQRRIARAFNKKVKPGKIKAGYMVLSIISLHLIDLKLMEQSKQLIRM